MKTTGKTFLTTATAWLLAIATMLMMQGCGSDDTFRVNGYIENYGTGNLRVVYHSNGAIQSVLAPAVDGKFSMTGRLDKPAFARVYTGNGIVAGRFTVKPGETIEAEFNISDPTAVKLNGNDDSKRLAKFITENAALIGSGDSKALNAVIDSYVRDNTKRLVSGVLMADYFDHREHEAQAAELISLLADEVVAATSLTGLRDLIHRLSIPVDSIRLEPFSLYSRGDSLESFNAGTHRATLLLFTDATSRKADSITAQLSKLRHLAKNGRLQIIDISCDPDTASWHSSLRATTPLDSLKKADRREIHRCWTPAPYNIHGLEQIPVAATPWFIVADSTGRVLYRGASIAKARAGLNAVPLEK